MDTATRIISAVSSFVGSTLLKPGLVDWDTIQRFVRELKPELTKAATFAVKDYYTM